jgi:hypothetical protein
MQKSTLESWFIDILPDLNQADPEVARYIVQNTLWWIGVTGSCRSGPITWARTFQHPDTSGSRCDSRRSTERTVSGL